MKWELAELVAPFTLWCYKLLHSFYACETYYKGVVNVENALLLITYLLFYGMIGMTLINLALLIIICFLLHRQYKNSHSALTMEWLFAIFRATTFVVSHFLYLLYILLIVLSNYIKKKYIYFNFNCFLLHIQ